MTPDGGETSVGRDGGSGAPVRPVRIAGRRLDIGGLRIEHHSPGAYATVQSDNVVQVQAPLMASGGVAGGLNVNGTQTIVNGDLIMDRADGNRALLQMRRPFTDPDTGAVSDKGFTLQTFAPGVGLNGEILILRANSGDFSRMISFDGANSRLGVNRYGAEETLDVQGNALVRGGIRVDNWNSISTPLAHGAVSTQLTTGERIRFYTMATGQHPYSMGIAGGEIWTSAPAGAAVGSYVGGVRRLMVNEIRAEFLNDLHVSGGLAVVQGNSQGAYAVSPAARTLAAGERVRLWEPGVGNYPHSLGIDGNQTWYGVPTAANHSFRVGAAEVARFDAGGARVNGDLRVDGNAAFDLGRSLRVEWPKAGGATPFVATTARGSTDEVVDKLQPVTELTFATDGCGALFDVAMFASGTDVSCVYHWRFAFHSLAAGAYYVVPPTDSSSMHATDQWELLVMNSSSKGIRLALRWKVAGKFTRRTPFVKMVVRAVQPYGTDPAGCVMADLTSTAATTDATAYPALT